MSGRPLLPASASGVALLTASAAALSDRCDVHPHIILDPDQIAGFCRRHHIRWLALFGSVLRDDFRPDSDVDVLVEFESEHPVGLIRLAGIELELSELLGRKVDLRTSRDLSRYFRQTVLDSAVVQYAEPSGGWPNPVAAHARCCSGSARLRRRPLAE
jgi:predicted nucleotidyltransferase